VFLLLIEQEHQSARTGPAVESSAVAARQASQLLRRLVVVPVSSGDSRAVQTPIHISSPRSLDIHRSFKCGYAAPLPSGDRCSLAAAGVGFVGSRLQRLISRGLRWRRVAAPMALPSHLLGLSASSGGVC